MSRLAKPRLRLRAGGLAFALLLSALALIVATSAAFALAGSSKRRKPSTHCTAHVRTHDATVEWSRIGGWGWKLTAGLAHAAGTSPSHRRGACARSHHRLPAGHGGTSSEPATGLSGTSTGSTGNSGASGSSPSSGEPSAPSGSTPGAGEETHSPPPTVTHVQVTAVEYHFTLSRTSVPAGKVDFDFVNAGQDEHNLNLLSGEGSISGSFPNTASKGVRDQTFEMRPGGYTLFCSLPEHEAKGMKATLTVE